MKIDALVPLRGGSKSIPLKNIKIIAGKPLCYWSIKAALDSGCFNSITVSTDSKEISNTVLDLFSDKVQILKRDASIASDTTTTEAVVLDYLTRSPSEVVCLIQATTPQVMPSDFIEAVGLFAKGGINSLVTCSRARRFRWTDAGKPLNYDPAKRPRRQDFQGDLVENGAFYLFHTKKFIDIGHRLPEPVAIFEMSEDALVELDEISDWLAVESILKKIKAL